MKTALYAGCIGSLAGVAEVVWVGWNAIGIVGSLFVSLLASGGALCILEAIKLKPPAEVTSNPDARSFEKGVLPCCGGTEFIEGPSGGMCLNIECATCHQKWNVAFINGSCLMADRI